MNNLFKFGESFINENYITNKDSLISLKEIKSPYDSENSLFVKKLENRPLRNKYTNYLEKLNNNNNSRDNNKISNISFSSTNEFRCFNYKDRIKTKSIQSTNNHPSTMKINKHILSNNKKTNLILKSKHKFVKINRNKFKNNYFKIYCYNNKTTYIHKKLLRNLYRINNKKSNVSNIILDKCDTFTINSNMKDFVNLDTDKEIVNLIYILNMSNMNKENDISTIKYLTKNYSSTNLIYLLINLFWITHYELKKISSLNYNNINNSTTNLLSNGYLDNININSKKILLPCYNNYTNKCDKNKIISNNIKNNNKKHDYLSKKEDLSANKIEKITNNYIYKKVKLKYINKRHEELKKNYITNNDKIYYNIDKSASEIKSFNAINDYNNKSKEYNENTKIINKQHKNNSVISICRKPSNILNKDCIIKLRNNILNNLKNPCKQNT